MYSETHVRWCHRVGRWMSYLAVLTTLATLSIGCGGSDGPTNPPNNQVTVSLTGPADGSSVNGTIALMAEATNATTVQFFVNGNEVVKKDKTAYSVDWNTTLNADGRYTVMARAIGTGGTVEDDIAASVDNDGVPVAVTLSSPPAEVTVGDTYQFGATVAGTANHEVTWSMDEGATHGTITPEGLFTAPQTVPTPPQATIRATSAADNTVSSTTQVTFTTGINSTEQNLIAYTFGAMYDVALIAKPMIEYCVMGVFFASYENGGTPTYTGTITQVPANPESFTWVSTPNDRLVVNSIYYDVDFEFIIDTFSGYIQGSWDEFFDSHTDLRFNVSAIDLGDLDIRSVSEYGPAYSDTVYFNRLIEGQVVQEGETLDVNVSHRGKYQSERSGGIFNYSSWDTGGGTIQWSGGIITVSEYYHYELWSSSRDAVQSLEIRNGSSCLTGTTTYQYRDVMIASEHTNSWVTQPSAWGASGFLDRNGAQFGVVEFPFAAIIDTHGPQARVRITSTGQTIEIGGVLKP